MTQRTQDSLVCSIPARELRSTTVLRWTKQQEDEFIDHILHHFDFENKYDDFYLLLERLGVDGFEDIKNDQDDGVHMIIVRKVQDKITHLRTKAGLGNQPIRDPSDDHGIQGGVARQIARDLYGGGTQVNTRANTGRNAERNAQGNAGENGV
ncbi:hypothetical protein RRF57_010225 [Xylaria bambusicola]|uniref:Uncharacterized protein n=1 Tax=Xylaria bambusicola TaxID=326684 RepID=A0AAN7US42_9PEZI